MHHLDDRTQGAKHAHSGLTANKDEETEYGSEKAHVGLIAVRGEETSLWQ